MTVPPDKKLLGDGSADETLAGALELVRNLDQGAGYNPYTLALARLGERAVSWSWLAGLCTLGMLGLANVVEPAAGIFVVGLGYALWAGVLPALAMRDAVRHVRGDERSTAAQALEELPTLLAAGGLLLVHLALHAFAFWLLFRAEMALGGPGVTPLVIALGGTAWTLWSWGNVLGVLTVEDRPAVLALPLGIGRAAGAVLRPRTSLERYGTGLGPGIILTVLCLIGSGFLMGFLRTWMIRAGLMWWVADSLAPLLLAVPWTLYLMWISSVWGHRYLKEAALRLLPEETGDAAEPPESPDP